MPKKKKEPILDVEAAKIATKGRVTLEEEEAQAQATQESLEAGVEEAKRQQLYPDEE